MKTSTSSPDAGSSSAAGPHTNKSGDEPIAQLKIGIAGGGQLAMMLADAATTLNLHTVVLDPNAQCSAVSHADELIVGDFASAEGLVKLARASDTVTFEIEQVDAGALEQLERESVRVFPPAAVLATIQDKLVQKEFLQSLEIPTSPFRSFDESERSTQDFPFVWKVRRGGYDGRGVAVVRTESECGALPSAPALREELVDIEREFAIIVARDVAGNACCYPLTEILMDSQAHVLDTVVAPAMASAAVEATSRDYATRIAHALNYVGVLAVELFLDRNGEVLVNELSPRPHNSGHYTIEACATSQFEQHCRAVAGLALGPTDLQTAAATFNLLSPVEPATMAQLADTGVLGSGVHVYDYAKGEARPGRKMGHITVTADTSAAALARVDTIKRAIAAHYGETP